MEISTWGLLTNSYDLLLLGLIVLSSFYFIFKFKNKMVKSR